MAADTEAPKVAPGSHPSSVCQQCGACCAFFRVSFYWAEAPERGLADVHFEKVNAQLACMIGTNRSGPRCTALSGEVGRQVACQVYAARPSPCREVRPGEDRCNLARAAHDLPPIESNRELPLQR